MGPGQVELKDKIVASVAKTTMAFLRLKLLEAILGHTKPNEPFCAVNIKEAVSQQDGSVSLQQKKKTFYPDWNHCFDSHLHAGRRMQIIVMDRLSSLGQETPVAEVTVETEALAQECMEEDTGNAVKLAVSWLNSILDAALGKYCLHICAAVLVQAVIITVPPWPYALVFSCTV